MTALTAPALMVDAMGAIMPNKGATQMTIDPRVEAEASLSATQSMQLHDLARQFLEKHVDDADDADGLAAAAGEFREEVRARRFDYSEDPEAYWQEAEVQFNEAKNEMSWPSAEA